MKAGLYPTIAFGNLKKNYRFFVPRIIAEAGLLGVFYIVYTLKSDARVLALRGGSYISLYMAIGTWVLMLLSAILMFYTNGFLMKQRKRELGLYNVLGMEKRHIGRVLFFETLASGAAAVALGLCLGMLFYKVSALLICRLLGEEVIFGFDFIHLKTLLVPGLFFVALDAVTYLKNRIAIARQKPVELLQSVATGEREPKIKWVTLILGILTLGAGYYISLATVNPLQAILLFFLAVVLVIVGTYCLFVAGSVFVLKTLKKNKPLYYHRRRMTAISGLIYRMKQNAVGLASIAILATGVLVMVSTTVSLYAGAEDTLAKNYPQHYYIPVRVVSFDGERGTVHMLDGDVLSQIVREEAAAQDLAISKIEEQRYLDVSFLYEGGRLTANLNSMNVSDNLTGLASFMFITEDTYVKLGGEPLNLQKDEAAVCCFDVRVNYKETQIELDDTTFRIKKILTTFPISTRMVVSIYNCYGMVVADDEALARIDRFQQGAYDNASSEFTNQLAVTFENPKIPFETGRAFDAAVIRRVWSLAESLYGESLSVRGSDSVWEARESISGMYGSLLFLGILLGLVCLSATALIIYYKQISESYEDQNRFRIMQKIGMSGREVRKTINTQVILVFLLPLLVSGIHLLFAFPILEKLLHVLLLSSTQLFVACGAIVYGLFALVYVLIYAGTSRTYYRIVR